MSKLTKAGSIRIIAGQWRGRKLPVINSEGLRPTTDRVRETLFNWLMHDIAGSHCLDLFAGSGALGLECLSRGAQFVQFVESNKQVAGVLKQNLARLSVQQQAQLVNQTAAAYLASNNKQFDCVFIDPPYNSELLDQTIELLDNSDCLQPQALVYFECSSNQTFSVPAQWQLHRQSKAGQCRFFLYRVN